MELQDGIATAEHACLIAAIALLRKDSTLPSYGTGALRTDVNRSKQTSCYSFVHEWLSKHGAVAGTRGMYFYIAQSFRGAVKAQVLSKP